MLHRIRRWAPPLALMVAIAVVSSRPAAPLPSGVNDKVAHAAAFGLLAWLWIRAWRPRDGKAVGVQGLLPAWAISAGYGAIDEWHQSYVPGRTASVADWIADASGAAVVVLLVLVLRAMRAR